MQMATSEAELFSSLECTDMRPHLSAYWTTDNHWSWSGHTDYHMITSTTTTPGYYIR